MTIAAAETLVLILALYAFIGAVFGLFFVTVGASRIDPAARAMPAPVRFLVFWGAAGLWPLMLVKVMRAEQPQ